MASQNSSTAAYKRKSELGISDNKLMVIKSIDGIDITNFRLIKDQKMTLGKNITIVSGRNGTMKSTLMGLIAHPFESSEKSVTGESMKTVFSDVFKLSTEKDTKYKYYIMMKLILENETVNLREPIKMYKHRNRFRLVPSGNNKGDGFFSLPS